MSYNSFALAPRKMANPANPSVGGRRGREIAVTAAYITVAAGPMVRFQRPGGASFRVQRICVVLLLVLALAAVGLLGFAAQYRGGDVRSLYRDPAADGPPGSGAVTGGRAAPAAAKARGLGLGLSKKRRSPRGDADGQLVRAGDSEAINLASDELIPEPVQPVPLGLLSEPFLVRGPGPVQYTAEEVAGKVEEEEDRTLMEPVAAVAPQPASPSPPTNEGGRRQRASKKVADWTVDEVAAWLADSMATRVVGGVNGDGAVAAVAEYDQVVRSLQINGRKLIKLIGSDFGQSGALAAALGMPATKTPGGGKRARLAAAVAALPLGRPSPQMAAAAKQLMAAKAAAKAAVAAGGGAVGGGKSPAEVATGPGLPALLPGAATGQGDSSAPTVAVLVIGLLRDFLEPKVFASQKYLLQPLAAEQAARGRPLHLFFCVNTGEAGAIRNRTIGASSLVPGPQAGPAIPPCGLPSDGCPNLWFRVPPRGMQYHDQAKR
eukprot:SAG22_NODE_436_length_10519_cov_21.912188_9_plen_491_part_00